MPGYHPKRSLNVGTADRAGMSVHAVLYGVVSMHSVNGYEPNRLNAAFELCAREGMFRSVVPSSTVRRSGSKCESTISRPPFEPMLGGSNDVAVTWLTLPYWMSRYQTSRPGALYGARVTVHSPVSGRKNAVSYADWRPLSNSSLFRHSAR